MKKFLAPIWGFISLFLFAYVIYQLYYNYDAIEYEKHYSGLICMKVVARSSSLLVLNSGERVGVLPTVNTKYSEPDLCSFIFSGDSIVKPAFSDTLYIYKNNREYFFIIDFSFVDD